MLSCNYDREKRGYNSDKKLLSLFIFKKESDYFPKFYTFFFISSSSCSSSIHSTRPSKFIFSEPERLLLFKENSSKISFSISDKSFFSLFSLKDLLRLIVVTRTMKIRIHKKRKSIKFRELNKRQCQFL